MYDALSFLNEHKNTIINNLNKNIEVYNRGNSGDRIADLYGRWVEECLNLNPTILSILIGINDIIFNWEHKSGSDPERYEKIYRYLLDEVKEKNPDTLIVYGTFLWRKKRAGT